MDPQILEQVYAIDTEINALNHKPIESGIAPDSYKLPKNELWRQILASSQYLIDQASPPVFQFMLLFNKSISIYGSQVYEDLGLYGLLGYTDQVIERLYSVYEERINQGYRSSLRYYDGRQDQYDFYQLGLLQRLKALYFHIVERFREISIQRKIPMNSDKVRLI